LSQVFDQDDAPRSGVTEEWQPSSLRAQGRGTTGRKRVQRGRFLRSEAGADNTWAV